MRNGWILHRFEFCCGYDLDYWEGFLGLFQGLRRALNVDGDVEWEAWKEKAIEEYRDDDRLKELTSRCQAVYIVQLAFWLNRNKI